jgi:hypothetical protein
MPRLLLFISSLALSLVYLSLSPVYPASLRDPRGALVGVLDLVNRYRASARGGGRPVHSPFFEMHQ